MRRPMTYVEERRRAEKADYEARIEKLEAEVDRMEAVCLDCPLLCRDRKRIEELTAQLEGMVPRAAMEKLQTDIAGRDAGIEELEKELADARAEIARLERELETELDHAKARARRPSNE